MADDLDQRVVTQQIAFQQDRRGDVEIVIGQDFDDVTRRIVRIREFRRQGLANRTGDILKQLFQDVVHQRQFMGRQLAGVMVDEIANCNGQGVATLRRAIASQIDQMAHI